MQFDVAVTSQSGINIAVGRFTQLGVRAQQVRPAAAILCLHSNVKIRTSGTARKRFSPEKRNCYFSNEIKMRDFNEELGTRYGISNCMVQVIRRVDSVESNTLELYLIFRQRQTRFGRSASATPPT